MSSNRAHEDNHDEVDDDDDDDIVVIEESSVKSKSKKKPAKAKAEDGDEKPAKKAKKDKKEGEGEEKVKKGKPPAKPLTAQEKNTAVAKGASMARNRSIAAHLKTFADAYKEGGEYIKAASANKAVKAILALTEPVVIARQISPLEGCGKGTVEKVEKFLEENPLAGVEEVVAQAHSEFSYLKDLERDIIISMLQTGEINFANVKTQRDDINEGDF